jgi:hypothetical protein
MSPPREESPPGEESPPREECPIMELPLATFKRLIVLCDGKWKPVRALEEQEPWRLMQYTSHDRNVAEFTQ